MTTTARIATLSLNPAIDHTARVSNFNAGRVNRVEWEQADAGGKGVNVASFLAHAGLPVAATGLLGSGNIEPFLELFESKGIEDRCVRLIGRTRVNVKIIDPALNQVTDINFPGLSPRPEDLVQLHLVLDALCADTDWFVLCGSVPADVPQRFYAELVERLKQRGKQVLLDASGGALAMAAEQAPDIIKPNTDELGELAGRRLESPADVLGAAKTLVASGIELVAVSMGAEGALFVNAEAALLALPPTVEIKSTVGTGDAMVAGILVAGQRGLDLADCACLATAFSLAALGEVGPNLPPMPIVESFAARVKIRELENS